MDTSQIKYEVGAVTALGRSEFEFLDEAAASLKEAEEHCGGTFQWSVALDGLNSPSGGARQVLRIARRYELDAVVVNVGAPGRSEGPGAARNAALSQFRARWMLTLDSDDRLVGAGVATMLRALAATPDASWAAGRCPHTDAMFNVTWEGPADPFEAGLVPVDNSFWQYKETTGNLPFLCTATIVRADAVRAAGGWPEDRCERAEDTALWSVLGARYPGVWVPEVVYLYRRHESSMTNRQGFSDVDEGLREIASMVAAGSTKVRCL